MSKCRHSGVRALPASPEPRQTALGNTGQGAVFIGSGPAKRHPGMTSSRVVQFLYPLLRGGDG
jgi:hypothetical protein